MQDNDCRRMVFASSITVYGAQADHPQPFDEYEPLRPGPSFHYELNKVYAEKMIADSGVDVVCAAHDDRRTKRTNRFGIVLSTAGSHYAGSEVRMQLIHTDDVGRFCAGAALGGPTGPVNLAAEDAITFTEIGHILGRPVVNPARRCPRSWRILSAGCRCRRPNQCPACWICFCIGHWVKPADCVKTSDSPARTVQPMPLPT
jgi:nucleoside-diphosphate-sugar epimerase